MPRTMFQELVSPQSRAHRRWYTLPLSFLVHTTVTAILVAVPLIATDVLPAPRVALHFVGNDVTPIIPTPPPALPTRKAAPPEATPDENGAPLVAPDRIGNESGVIFQQDTIATQALDGIVRIGCVAECDRRSAPPSCAPSPIRRCVLAERSNRRRGRGTWHPNIRRSPGAIASRASSSSKRLSGSMEESRTPGSCDRPVARPCGARGGSRVGIHAYAAE